MQSFLTALLKSPEGKAMMGQAESNFAGSTFNDLSEDDLSNWEKNVLGKVVKILPGGAVDRAQYVIGAMKNWVKTPYDENMMGVLQRSFEAMATQMVGFQDPRNMDKVRDFQNSCYSTMVTMALTLDNLKQGLGRRDPMAMTIDRGRVATTCDEYVDDYGELPATAMIGSNEKASDYWKSKMNQIAPLAQEQAGQVLTGMQTIETSTDLAKVDKAMESMLDGIQEISKSNSGEAALAGLAEMVFTEAMRSRGIMPNGAYRSTQPTSSRSSPLSNADRQAMLDTIKDRPEERRKEGENDPTRPIH